MSAKFQNVKKNSLKIDFEPLPVKDPDEQDDAVVTTCGIGFCHPQWLQVANTPKSFLINHSVLGVLQGAFFTYLVGCLSTLEKRYDYETKVTGIIMIGDELSPILFGALLGFFGGKSHRPRIVVMGMVVASLSCFVMALPYFIYGSVEDSMDPSILMHLYNRTTYELCDLVEKDHRCETSPTLPAVSILFLGNALKGFGSLAFYTIGTSFLDDNIKKKNSPIYFGTLFTLRLLGPTLGFLLSSLCLSYYENPYYDPGYGPKDPRWVGAWWLGFVILGIAIFLFALPMVLFPRRFPGKKEVVPEKKKEKESKSTMEQIKDMGKALKRLINNPILMCHYLSGVFQLNGIVGYYVLLPKYMETQFRQSASKANLYSGPASLVGMMIGIFCGGLAIRKLKPRPRIMTAGIVTAESCCLWALIICMFITCPVYPIAGINNDLNANLNLTNTCNDDCLCTTKVYTPVCGPDGRSTYFSPCFAGCSEYNRTDGKEYFTNCKCVHNGEEDSEVADVKKGYCGTDCQLIVAYVAVLGVGKLLSSTARVGSALVTLRCVDPEDKSLALGALSGVFSLLAFIPYPLIYGALTDASCLVWEKSCGKTGNCWVYDTDKFRYLLHGVSAGFVFLGCLANVFVCILSNRLKNLYDEDGKNTKDDDIINNDTMLDALKTGMPRGSISSMGKTQN